ncbi:MAG: hypothetical protein MK226_22705 [Saprospiraceae bacterium]|nr:hypothetical protein [Saprospiraceae bacterium]
MYALYVNGHRGEGTLESIEDGRTFRQGVHDGQGNNCLRQEGHHHLFLPQAAFLPEQ